MGHDPSPPFFQGCKHKVRGSYQAQGSFVRGITHPLLEDHRMWREVPFSCATSYGTAHLAGGFRTGTRSSSAPCGLRARRRPRMDRTRRRPKGRRDFPSQPSGVPHGTGMAPPEAFALLHGRYQELVLSYFRSDHHRSPYRSYRKQQ